MALRDNALAAVTQRSVFTTYVRIAGISYSISLRWLCVGMLGLLVYAGGFHSGYLVGTREETPAEALDRACRYPAQLMLIDNIESLKDEIESIQLESVDLAAPLSPGRRGRLGEVENRLDVHHQKLKLFQDVCERAWKRYVS